MYWKKHETNDTTADLVVGIAKQKHNNQMSTIEILPIIDEGIF